MNVGQKPQKLMCTYGGLQKANTKRRSQATFT